MNKTVDWKDADVEAVAEAMHDTYERGRTLDGWRGIARSLLASGVVVPARVVEEAQDRLADGLHRWREDAMRAEADLSRLRSAVEALADEWDTHRPTCRLAARELRDFLLTEGRDRAGESPVDPDAFGAAGYLLTPPDSEQADG